MNKIILIILLITTLNLNAQNHFIGIKGGVNWTNVTTQHSYKYRTGISSELTYEYLNTKHYSFIIGINYNQRGYINECYFKTSDNSPIEKTVLHNDYYYLSVPIKATYNIGDNIFGFISIGVSPSFLIEAKNQILSFDYTVHYVKKETINNTDKAQKFDLAGLVEIGGGYKLSDKLILFSSFAYQRSFITFSNSSHFSIKKYKHYGMTLSLGFKYALTK